MRRQMLLLVSLVLPPPHPQPNPGSAGSISPCSRDKTAYRAGGGCIAWLSPWARARSVATRPQLKKYQAARFLW
ncbi:hypothetical protein BGZ63DRAFT_383587 [Mariannaea sp. PMI_226]|nr:hypothetical protein BGZ63DRAFT_383587 [Mariannaea sp. PMI_226]